MTAETAMTEKWKMANKNKKRQNGNDKRQRLTTKINGNDDKTTKK
jgi:hypothetical protein